MNDLAWGLIVATSVVAALDWVAVGTGRRALEYVCKPATMFVLIGAALALDPVDAGARWWFVAALVCSLAGDVFLMLPDERLFVYGLGSFLVGHLAYIAGLVAAGVSGGPLVVGCVVVAVLMLAGTPAVVAGVRRADRRLVVPVVLYTLVISAMVAVAIGSTVALAVVGAALFYLSDYTIAISRFVTAFPGARLVIMTTYHAAQVLLVISLTVAR